MSMGWICPKCGRALAPWMSECPCNNVKTITTNFHTNPHTFQKAVNEAPIIKPTDNDVKDYPSYLDYPLK